MVTRVWRPAICSLTVVLLVAACSGGGGSSLVKSASSASPSSSSAPQNKQKIGKNKAAQGLDDKIITAAIADVQRFWDEEYPQVYGGAYAPISGGQFPYGPNNPPPKCGGTGKASYQDVAKNAFYCPAGDFVAWDHAALTNKMLDQFGPFSLGIVIAHELGHSVQARHGILDGQFITFVTEQQADCFAGAWTRWVADGNSKSFNVGLSDLDNALGGFLEIRDPVGTDTVNDTAAHGSAFQRINAFEDGLQDGAEKCRTYEDGSINFVPETFTDETDLAHGGDLPYAEVEPAFVQNLEGFWAQAFTDINKTWTAARINAFDPDTTPVTCGPDSARGDDAVGLAFYCEPDDTIAWDEAYLMPAVYDQVGDFGQATIVSNLYAERAQALAGLETGTLDASLQQACFTGAWTGTVSTSELSTELTLSPGDLDEAVSTFLQFSDNGTDVAAGNSTTGSAFQRLDAFRTGFFTARSSGYNPALSECVSGGGASAASSDSQASALSDSISNDSSESQFHDTTSS